MKTEISAGGIIVRKNGDIWEVLVVRDRNESLTFPKGKIETGESEEISARREIAEEVGVTKITMLQKLPPVYYTYRRNGLVSKTVHFFIFQTIENEPLVPQKEEGLHEAQWMPLNDVIKEIGYPDTNKQLLMKTKDFLWKLHPHQT